MYGQGGRKQKPQTELGKRYLYLPQDLEIHWQGSSLLHLEKHENFGLSQHVRE